MSEWVTDRLPTREDGLNGLVYDSRGEITIYFNIRKGDAWKPIPKCEPYVKPKRFTVNYVNSRKILWYVWDEVDRYYVANKILTPEAAERIAAIYEEVMP